MVYSKAAVYICKPLVYKKKKLKERCYLHSVQQTYEKNSCKPGIKYFTSVNHQFTLVNCQFTSVNHCITVICQFTSVNCCITVICQFTSVNHRITVICFMKDHLLRTATFLVWFVRFSGGWIHMKLARIHEIRQIAHEIQNISFWVITKYRSFLTKDQTWFTGITHNAIVNQTQKISQSFYWILHFALLQGLEVTNLQVMNFPCPHK